MSNNLKENQFQKDEVSLKDAINSGKDWALFFLGYKWRFVIACLLGGSLGFIYAKYFSSTIFTANVSFTLEQRNGSGGALGGLASSLGLGDVGGSSSGMFGGENVLFLMKSNRIIHQSLKETQKDLNGDNLLNEYLKNHFEKSLKEMKINLFPKNLDSIVFTRKQDSLLLIITKNIRESQIIAERQDNKTSIINLEVKDMNEQWAYLFSKALVKNAIELYLEIKVGKLLRTEQELTQKKDSIRGLLNGSIKTLAIETDLDSHIPLLRNKTNQAKKQIDVNLLTSLYGSVVQNLEMARIQRGQEEPIIEIIDEPLMPLVKNNLGKSKSVLFGSILFSMLLFIWLFFNRLIKNI